jgi:hypothetical protein
MQIGGEWQSNINNIQFRLFIPPSIRKKIGTTPTSGGRSVGIVRLRTKSHGVFFLGYRIPTLLLST